MKHIALSAVLGLALFATSALAGADTPNARLTGSSFMTTISNWIACAIDDQNSCVTSDTNTNPTIKNT